MAEQGDIGEQGGLPRRSQRLQTTTDQQTLAATPGDRPSSPGYPTLQDLVGMGETATPTNSRAGVPTNSYSWRVSWPTLPIQLKQRERQLKGTQWKVMLERWGGTAVCESWVYLEGESPWYTFSSNGRAAKVDSRQLASAQRDYEAARKEKDLETKLFPEEVVRSVIEYFDKKDDLGVAARAWATSYKLLEPFHVV